jgi:hypothetical protein
MTAPLPPTSGPVSAGDRGGMQGAEQPMDIQQPLLEGPIAAGMAAAVSAEEGRQQEAAVLAGSPQGFGSGGFSPSPSSEGTHWNTDMSFEHQGP